MAKIHYSPLYTSRLACLKRGILEITSRWILFALRANLGEIYILLKLVFWYFYFVSLGKVPVYIFMKVFIKEIHVLKS